MSDREDCTTVQAQNHGQWCWEQWKGGEAQEGDEVGQQEQSEKEMGFFFFTNFHHQYQQQK